MKSVWIVIPLYNEAINVELVHSEVTKAVNGLSYQFNILFVDDGSKDETWQKLSQLNSSKGVPFQALRLTRNFGKEAALLAGLENVPPEASAVICMDADLQHPPSLIPQLIQQWERGEAKIIEGVKNSRGHESLVYKFFSKLYYRILSAGGSLKFGNSSDFKLLDRQVVEAIHSLGDRNLFFRGMTAWLGFPVTQVSFDVQDRVGGDRNMSLKARIRLAIVSITSFTTAPLRLIINIAFLFIVLSLLFASYTIYQKIIGRAVEGFTTVIVLELFIGGTVLLALGIIGNYLACIYEEVRQRPRYLLLETKNRDKESCQ